MKIVLPDIFMATPCFQSGAKIVLGAARLASGGIALRLKTP